MKRKEGCRPGGPWCVGMKSALGANVRNGLRTGMISAPCRGGMRLVVVVVHNGLPPEIFNGKLGPRTAKFAKNQPITLNRCPFCGYSIKPRIAPVKK